MDDNELEEILEKYATKGRGLSRSTKLWHNFSIFHCKHCRGKHFQPETETPPDNLSIEFVGILRLHCSGCGTARTVLEVTSSSTASDQTIVTRPTCQCGSSDFLVANFEMFYESDLEGASTVAACIHCGRCQTLAFDR